MVAAPVQFTRLLARQDQRCFNKVLGQRAAPPVRGRSHAFRAFSLRRSLPWESFFNNVGVASAPVPRDPNRGSRAIAIASFSLVACTGSSGGTTSDDTASAAAESAAAPEQPADLVGEWVQSNSESPDSYQAATISADSIEILWVSDGGETTALYWAGTYEVPTAPGAFEWDSQNDTEKTSAAMLASGDPTKTFSFDGETIRYEVSAMGVTKTVELERQ